jgi:hypothetical protein
MKTKMRFCWYLAIYLSERVMLQRDVVEKNYAHISCPAHHFHKFCTLRYN